MEAKELRIGNLLNYQTAEGDIFITTIDWQDLKLLSEDNGGFNSVHSPIPLTKEWLLKLGFEQLKWGDFILTYYLKGNILYSLSDGNVELNNPNVTLTQLKHVHQL